MVSELREVLLSSIIFWRAVLKKKYKERDSREAHKSMSFIQCPCCSWVYRPGGSVQVAGSNPVSDILNIHRFHHNNIYINTLYFIYCWTYLETGYKCAKHAPKHNIAITLTLLAIFHNKADWLKWKAQWNKTFVYCSFLLNAIMDI